jgi:hypothetical protein
MQLIVIFTHYIMSCFPAFSLSLSLSLLQLLPSGIPPIKKEEEEKQTTALVKQAC